MNLLTINNDNVVGYNVYEFLKYYKDQNYYLNNNDFGDLIVYEQFFPNQMLNAILHKKKIENVNDLFDESINNFYKKSLTKKINKIYFFYPFSFYSKNDYNFDILKIIKNKIENKFKKETNFILNNHFEDDDYKHFNAFREIKKEKKYIIKNKIFLSLNGKEREHRNDLFNFLNKNNLFNYFYFSYSQKNINLWKIEDYDIFGQKYLENENNSGHLAFEYYLNDDFYNLNNGHFFDQSYYYIITETNASDNLCFISEKTYKSFYHQIPFIVIGNPYTLKNLKKEGFKTFSKWIDESYDLEINYEKRKNKIYNEIKRISLLSKSEHEKNISEMKDILEHNYKHFLDTSSFKENFLNLF